AGSSEPAKPSGGAEDDPGPVVVDDDRVVGVVPDDGNSVWRRKGDDAGRHLAGVESLDAESGLIRSHVSPLLCSLAGPTGVAASTRELREARKVSHGKRAMTCFGDWQTCHEEGSIATRRHTRSGCGAKVVAFTPHPLPTQSGEVDLRHVGRADP